MIKKDLFEVLRDKVHCEFLSDLKFIDFEKVRIHLQHLNYDDFELREINDAINWFGGTPDENLSKQDAWEKLVNLHK